MLCHSASKLVFCSLKCLEHVIRIMIPFNTCIIANRPDLRGTISSSKQQVCGTTAIPHIQRRTGYSSLPESEKKIRFLFRNGLNIDLDLRKNSNSKFIQSPSIAATESHKHLLSFTTSRRKYLTLDMCLIDEDT